MHKILIGLSGGVDSAVAALLLKDQGFDVVGVTLRTWESDTGEESRCCEIEDARGIAGILGIPFYAFNCTFDFKEKVVTPFVDSYIKGMTPNPCIECNPYIKWEKMMYYMQVLGCDGIATGHYARLVTTPEGRYTVKRAAFAKKDQTYMLYKLTQDQLSKTVMPLGEYSKDKVREIAREAGIPVADKPDSQEICFIPDDDHGRFIREFCGGDCPGQGHFVDDEGNILGTHKGIINYTIGQRKGLGIAFGHPMFVKRIDPDRNEVVLGRDEDLYKDRVICDETNFLSIEGMKPGERLSCRAKIRYRHEAEEAELLMEEEGRLRIEFKKPVRAVTPGQAAVFYDEDDCVIGGGRITQ